LSLKHISWLLLSVFGPTCEAAEMYTFVDEQGQVHAVDSKSLIPEKFLGTEIKLSDLKSEQSSSAIGLSRFKNIFLVRVVFSEKVQAQLVLDTGASGTSISSRIASELGLQSVGSGTAIGASGQVKTTFVVVPELTVGEFKVHNLRVSFDGNEQGDGIEGLLGMDFLGQFNIELDAKSAALYLTKKTPKP
jgi:clan AA aspartic protease (TIGR02281 family)